VLLRQATKLLKDVIVTLKILLLQSILAQINTLWDSRRIFNPNSTVMNSKYMGAGV